MTLTYRGARELAALVAEASANELEEIVRQLAGDGFPDHSVAQACGLDKQTVRRVVARSRYAEEP